MKRIIVLAMILFIAIAGTASAGLTHGAEIYNAAGTAEAPNPLQIKPGETITLSYQATKLNNASGSADYSYAARSLVGGNDSDITVTFAHPFTPDTEPTYTDVGVIEMTLDANAPVGATYEVTIQVADTTTFIYGQASREISSIPEFPTVALPIAAIIGLAFFIQRRKEE